MSTNVSSRPERSHETSAWTTSYGEGTFAMISGTKHRKHFDERALARLGKKQELKVYSIWPHLLNDNIDPAQRRFGFLSVFGFSCCILITWETALVLSQEAFSNGGPAGVVWGYLIAWICSLSVYICLAEMASIAPIAGGQYFWVAVLSPPRYKRFLSYLTGWLTSLAWVATIGTGIIFVGTLIQGMIVLDYPDYDKERYQGTLLCWAVVSVALFINVLLAGLLPFLEGIILTFHVLGFVAVMVTLLYLSPKVDVSDVFFRVLNLGGWSTQGLSYCIGFTGNVATFVGADAAVHMSEEIEDAALDVPRAIVTTILLNGALGYGMIIALLFCMTDITAAVNTKTGYAFIEVFASGCGVAGATVLTAIVTTMIWCAVIGFLATASRMIWSFARDKAFPFHRIIRQIHPKTSIPIYAVLIATVIPCLLALIYIGSPIAYQDVLSMSVSGLYASYLLPISLLLWRRIKGHIAPYDSLQYAMDHQHAPLPARQVGMDDLLLEKDQVVDVTLMWGPWRIPGIWGTLNNAFACVYCAFVLFWSFWPSKARPDGAEMNYAVASFVGVTVFSIAYYLVYGHKEYQGPLTELSLGNSAVG